MRSEASTVEAYLAELPDDRREAIAAVRAVVLENLPDGYVESMRWGMITYEVPLETYPDTYNKQPLMFAALASQKNHMGVYMMGIYISDDARDEFEKAYRATGKRFDVGKSCVRFRKLEDLPLELIGETIASVPVDRFIGRVEESGGSTRKAKGLQRRSPCRVHADHPFPLAVVESPGRVDPHDVPEQTETGTD
jgi:uncharacterized protein YdhG (YjbR/CyaY superfamily)